MWMIVENIDCLVNFDHVTHAKVRPSSEKADQFFVTLYLVQGEQVNVFLGKRKAAKDFLENLHKSVGEFCMGDDD